MIAAPDLLGVCPVIRIDAIRLDTEPIGLRTSRLPRRFA